MIASIKCFLPRLFNIFGLAVVAGALLLTACASGPRIFANQSPTAAFSNYQSYNFQEPLGTDGDKEYRTLLSNYLVAATNREMQARGYRRSDSPDLWINFYVHSKEKIRSTTTPVTGGYYGWRGRYSVYGGYETTTTQYTEGTLNFDMVDSKTNELVWEGIAIGRIDDEVLGNLEKSVDMAVAAIFERFDQRADGGSNTALLKEETP